MGRKALFFDIDWTLYDHRNKQFPKSGLEAIRKAKAKGHLVFLCSARPYDSIKDFGLYDLGIEWDGYIASVGAVVYTDGKFLRKTLIKPKLIHRFDAFCRKYGLTYELVSPTSRELAYQPNAYMHNLRKVFQDGYPKVRRYHGQEIISMLLFAPSNYDRLIRETFPQFICFRFADYGVDVNGEIHLKGDGIREVLEYYHIDPKDAYAFGDGDQDISMKEAVHNLVAMGNGSDALKKEASYVTSSIEDDGIAKALVHYGLIESL